MTRGDMANAYEIVVVAMGYAVYAISLAVGAIVVGRAIWRGVTADLRRLFENNEELHETVLPKVEQPDSTNMLSLTGQPQ